MDRPSRQTARRTSFIDLAGFARDAERADDERLVELSIATTIVSAPSRSVRLTWAVRDPSA